MDQPDAVSSHNREAWDAQVERGNRWTVPVDHQAIETARRGTFGGAVDGFQDGARGVVPRPGRC
jgi:hypothetical protein